jgi:hypothetical protein
MAAGTYNFTIEQGVTNKFEVAFQDGNGDPHDLTGYSARMQIRDKVGGSTVHLTLSSSLDASGTGLNMSGSNGTNPPVSGTIGVNIAAVTSSLLDFNSAVYDLEIASGSGSTVTVVRLLQGKIKLSKEITQGAY